VREQERIARNTEASLEASLNTENWGKATTKEIEQEFERILQTWDRDSLISWVSGNTQEDTQREIVEQHHGEYEFTEMPK